MATAVSTKSKILNSEWTEGQLCHYYLLIWSHLGTYSHAVSVQQQSHALQEVQDSEDKIHW